MESGPGFKMDAYVAKKGGCQKQVNSKITIDKIAYAKHYKDDADFYIKLNPRSGYMTRIKKDTTVLINWEKEYSMAFPALGIEENTLIPMFDSVEDMQIGHEEFFESFKFI